MFGEVAIAKMKKKMGK